MAQEHKVDPPPQGAETQTEDDQRFPVRLILLGLLGLYVVVFIILNSKSVSVSFVFFSTKISLVVGLVLAIVLGFIGGYFVRELRDRRRRKPAAPRA